MKNKKELLRMLKFTLFSISAGLIQLSSYTLFFEALHWAPWLAYLVSLILSVIWNFTFNRKYTFQSAANVPQAMLKTLLFYLVFTPVSTWWTAALTGANPFTGAEASSEPLVNNYIVQLGTMLINFVLEYLYQRLYVFRGHVDDRKKNEENNPEGSI